jgi:hypothetical protein
VDGALHESGHDYEWARRYVSLEADDLPSSDTLSKSEVPGIDAVLLRMCLYLQQRRTKVKRVRGWRAVRCCARPRRCWRAAPSRSRQPSRAPSRRSVTYRPCHRTQSQVHWKEIWERVPYAHPFSRRLMEGLYVLRGQVGYLEDLVEGIQECLDNAQEKQKRLFQEYQKVRGYLCALCVFRAVFWLST